MPYVYIGLPSPYGGKPLFHILNNLRKFGEGRIVYRTTDYAKRKEPSFFRILLAQPEMDPKQVHGRVIAERVLHGIRQPEPVNISDSCHLEDFRLVPKDEEEEFCKWSEIRDYNPELDAISKPKYMEMPPLLRQIITTNRRRQKRGGAAAETEVIEEEEEEKEEELLLPAYKLYSGNFKLLDKVESNDLSAFITDPKYATFKDYDFSKIPIERWNHSRLTISVGHKEYLKNSGKEWEEQVQRMEKYQELKNKVEELRL